MTHFTSTSRQLAITKAYCARQGQLEVLTSAEVIEQKLPGHRFMVELATLELEIDEEGIPVPKDFKVIEVVVAKPTAEAIEQLIAAVPFLDAYSVVSFSLPEEGDCPF